MIISRRQPNRGALDLARRSTGTGGGDCNVEHFTLRSGRSGNELDKEAGRVLSFWESLRNFSLVHVFYAGFCPPRLGPPYEWSVTEHLGRPMYTNFSKVLTRANFIVACRDDNWF